MRYFEAFPVIDYGDSKVRNILERVKVLELAKSQTSVYHPFTILDGESPRKIAFDYYENSDYFWIIFLVNNIIDPYYDWPLSSVEFENFIAAKYGSVATAQSTTLFYRRNPVEWLVSISDPNVYYPKATFSGDASGFQTIVENKEIRLSPSAYALSPDGNFYAVDAYSYEHELNEAKRNILLLDRKYVRLIERELKDLLK